MRCLARCLITLVFITHITLLADLARAAEIRVSADRWAAWEQRQSSDPARSLVVEGIVLNAGQMGRTMTLERVEPFAADGRIRINGQWAGEISRSRHYYRGILDDEPGSIATLSIGSDGGFRGLLSSADGYWIFTNAEASGDEPMQLIARPQTDAPKARAMDVKPERSFQCQVDRQVRDVSAISRDARINPATEPLATLGGATPRYRVRVAFESDHTFFQLFQGQANPAQSAQDYLGDLVNYISGIYINDLNTELQISSVSLWNSAATQPWQNLGNTGCLLNEMGIYWNNPNNAVDATRTVAHFVTGSSTPEGGVAWVGALCATAQNVDTENTCTGFSGIQNAFGDYGVSGGLEGNFDANTQPTVWDYVVVAHELGHNFNSDHTHCYNTINVPGFASTVIDQCYNGEQGNGCWNGPETLPGTAGQGSGTIMSYCHLLNPGLANIAPNFGLNHPFGDSPERVPTVMRSHVLAAAATNGPRCPQLVDAPPPPPPGLCSQVGQAIPDDNPQGLSNTLQVADVGSIDRLELLLDIDHSYVGDLILDLEHGPSGTTVRLVDRPGVSGAIPFGCAGSNIKTTLDDQAVPSVQDSCQSQQGQAAYPQARYRPANPLSAFAGRSLSGAWTLRVSDNANGDTGQLLRWCLVPTTGANQDVIFLSGFEQ